MSPAISSAVDTAAETARAHQHEMTRLLEGCAGVVWSDNIVTSDGSFVEGGYHSARSLQSRREQMRAGMHARYAVPQWRMAPSIQGLDARRLTMLEEQEKRSVRRQSVVAATAAAAAAAASAANTAKIAHSAVATREATLRCDAELAEDSGNVQPVVPHREYHADRAATFLHYGTNHRRLSIARGSATL